MVRVNGRIRAREVRVIGDDGRQLGVLTLPEALGLARSSGVDLVEIAPNASPPVCRLVDYGKFRYEQAKKEKETKKHQHANKVKEIQLSAAIDPHDFSVKLSHAIDFLCDEMKVKITLKFRGREFAHQEFGFQVVQKFIGELAPYARPDAPPKLIGKGISTMLSPLPRSQRAKGPKETANHSPVAPDDAGPNATAADSSEAPSRNVEAAQRQGFAHNPFAELNINVKR